MESVPLMSDTSVEPYIKRYVVYTIFIRVYGLIVFNISPRLKLWN